MDFQYTQCILYFVIFWNILKSSSNQSDKFILYMFSRDHSDKKGSEINASKVWRKNLRETKIPKGQCAVSEPNKWSMFWSMQKTATSKSASAKFAKKKLVAVRIDRWTQITKIVNKFPRMWKRLNKLGNLLIIKKVGNLKS